MVTVTQQLPQISDDGCIHKQPCQVGDVVLEEAYNSQQYADRGGCLATDDVLATSRHSDSPGLCNDFDYDEEDEEEGVVTSNEVGWTMDLSTPAVTQHSEVVTANGGLVLPTEVASTFGDICVKNSSNVHLGNKTFYKGPVTIKQFVYTNPVKCEEDGSKGDASSRVSETNGSEFSTFKSDNAVKRLIHNQDPNYYKELFVSEQLTSGTLNPALPYTSSLAYKGESTRITQWLWTWRCAALLCILALIFITTIVVCSVMLTRNSDIRPAPVFPEIPDSSISGVIVSNVRFVERSEWGAQPPTAPLTRMKLPVPYVIISHTATEFCRTQSACTLHVRFAQTFHIESRNWSDIAYNFLVGGDGLAYVGRSWDFMGAHSFGFNNKSIGISFIGTFNDVIPPKTQLHAAQRIIEIGVENGKIAKDYKLLGHRQISQTVSPGDALYSIIKTWPHWSPSP